MRSRNLKLLGTWMVVLAMVLVLLPWKTTGADRTPALGERLMEAASRGDIGTVKSALSRGADVNTRRGDRGVTALMSAVVRCHRDVAKALLAGGADVNAKSRWGYSPLHFAVSIPGQPPLRTKGFLSRLKEVITWPTRSCTLGMVKLLMDGGADVNAKTATGDTPLHIAAARPVSRSLRNVTFWAGLRDVIEWPAPEGREQMILLLVNRGADVNAKNCLGETPLMWAANRGHEKVVRLLLNRGADVNAMNTMGETPLMWAAKGGSRNIAELLLHRGADARSMNRSGLTALAIAQKSHHWDVVRLLKEGITQ